MPLASVAAVTTAACTALGTVVLVAAAGSASVTGASPGGAPPPAAARRTVAARPHAAGDTEDDRPVRYSAPVSPLTVVRRFDPPAHRFGPGHLGVDLRSSPNGVVRAAADGVVSFSGQVAGRGVVVVRHRDGISTEYEPVTVSVGRGATVSHGEVIGHVRGVHRGCPGTCLHWGAWRTDPGGRVYLDPLSLLRRLGVVRLLPWGRE